MREHHIRILKLNEKQQQQQPNGTVIVIED
jgi:hypothetical protein